MCCAKCPNWHSSKPIEDVERLIKIKQQHLEDRAAYNRGYLERLPTEIVKQV